MNQERREISKDQRTILVDKILSSTSHFEAFIAFDQVKRAQVVHFEAAIRLTHECNLIGGGGGYVEDHELNIAIASEREIKERLHQLRGLVGQQRAVDENFGKAYLEIQDNLMQITGIGSGLGDSHDFGNAIDVLDSLRQDYRLQLMELAHDIKKDTLKEEAFRLYSGMAKTQLEWSYSKDADQHERYLQLQEQYKRRAEDDDFRIKFLITEQEIKTITDFSGVQGPFGEQFIIESVENLIDPDLKKSRDNRAGRGRF